MRNELVKNMTQTSLLGWVKYVESTVHTEALSRKLLKGLGFPNSTAEVKVDIIRTKLK